MNDRLTEFFTGWTFRRVMIGTMIVLGVIGLAYTLVSFANVFIVVFIAFLISTAVRPLVHYMQRYKVPPALGVIIVYIGLFIALAGLAVVVVPLVVDQVSTISVQLPEYYNDLRRILINSSSTIIRSISLRLPVEPPLFMVGLDSTVSQTPDDPAAAVTQLFSVLADGGKILFVIIATFLLAFFWTLDGERVIRTLIKLVNPDNRENVRETVQEVQLKLGAYIRGQIILDLFVGGLATIAYFFIGLDYVIVLGILAGILETVPIIGPILGAIPAAVIAVATGDTTMVIWVIVATVAIQQIEGAILVPRVMDKAVGVNAVVTLLAFAAFSSFLGLVGGLLAVPFAAVLQIIITRILFLRSNQPEMVIQQRDWLGVLRYDTQELAQTINTLARDDTDEHDDDTQSLEDELEAIVVDLDKLLVQVSQEGQA